jgi:hypothetical protein
LGTGSASGGSTVDAAAASSAGIGCLLILVLASVGLYFWAALYPFSALASVAAGVSAYLLLHDRLPNAHSPGIPLNANAVLAAFGVALVALWIASRLDHRLARRPVYRATRHVVRLGIIAVWVSVKLQGIGFLTPGFPRAWRPFQDPVEIGAALMAVVGMHFLMWTDNRVRDTWHGMLEAIRLR